MISLHQELSHIDCEGESATTIDSLCNGALLVEQPRRGYRFSVDAVLIAHFSQPKAGWRVLDLGCGVGVIALLLAHRCPQLSLVALELQRPLAALARANAARNNFAARMQVIEADLAHIAAVLAAESFDQVVCNPPYWPGHSGRLNQDHQAARARHATQTTLADFIAAAAFAVKNRGRAVFVYPARSQALLQQALLAKRLNPQRLQAVYSSPDAKQASLVLVEAVKNGGGDCSLPPPCYIFSNRQGLYSKAMERMYAEGRCWPEY